MPTARNDRPSLIVGIVAAVVLVASSTPARAQQPDARDDASPWGIASGAEKSGEYPKFLPLLHDAGVTWLRYFPEWTTIQPRQGQWNWKWSDDFVATARSKQVRVAGIFLYFAPWASADGKSTRAFPVKDMQFWRDYVKATVTRYHKGIKYWEVWNEENSPAFNQGGTPKDYAEMVRVAYDTAHAVDPDCKIGITCAAFDLHYFDQVIKHGAAGHFDYVCVHPYNSIGYVFGSESSYLSMAGNIRRMLADNHQRQDMPLWISEIGLTTTDTPKQQRRQAEGLVKTYLLSIVQGFDRVFWFEAIGPKYGEGVHAILRDDLAPRPAYTGLKAMTAALGPTPKYAGWTNLGGDSYGFLFGGPHGPVLALWATHAEGAKVRFSQPVEVTDIEGKTTSVPADIAVSLGTSPVFIGNLPAEIVTLARKNAAVRFPWSKDYSHADSISCRLGATNVEAGIRQGNNDPRPDGLTIPGQSDGQTYRTTDLGNRRPFIYFDVDSSYLGWGDKDIDITVVARRAKPDQPAVMTVVYESQTGYHEYGKRTPVPGLTCELLYESDGHRAPEVWHLDPGSQWQEHTWHIHDACFIQKWGWSFQVNVEQSSADVSVREVRIKKTPP
jgi:polysaccharide biosynthesis protein PslG